jgi:hypothetical protein
VLCGLQAGPCTFFLSCHRPLSMQQKALSSAQRTQHPKMLRPPRQSTTHFRSFAQLFFSPQGHKRHFFGY